MKTAAQSPRLPARETGKLTIFTGYASGCGKTYAMLKAADFARQNGQDVVIGCISNRWPDTLALAEPFSVLPQITPAQGQQDGNELDLDAALKRMPQIIVMDDLSHQNSPGLRHKQRYQDVNELLKAGINVYTTLNIQHIESLQDSISSILGQALPERVPDRIFNLADQVEFIDSDPQTLYLRLSENNLPSSPPPSLTQLNALRELAFRRCADWVAQRSESTATTNDYHTHEHILVCLSASPSNEKIIRTAARMAGAFRCDFTALFVETKAFQMISQADKDRLRANIHLAEQLGASIETVYGDDIPYQISEFARLSGVTRIVMGRSEMSHKTLFRPPTLTEHLITLSPEVDIHIIPDADSTHRVSAIHQSNLQLSSLALRDFFKSVFFLFLATAIGALFFKLGFTESNIITIYLLSVMLISVTTKSSVCSLIASIASVLIFNFFFTEPRFSLKAYDSSYPVTFLVMFLAALITSSLAARLKSHAKRSAQVAWRTKMLFETNQRLQRADTQDEIISITAKQLVKIFQRDVVVYPVENKTLAAPVVFSAKEVSANEQNYITPREQKVAQWVLKNNRRAGAFTETFSDAACLYLAVRINSEIYAVVGLNIEDRPPDEFESSILLSVLGECALALENQKNAAEKEAAAVLAKNEQLRANLLRSISHDLRTPLTSISGNASNLLSNGDLFDSKTKNQMYTDIYDDAMWLINLVENLLSVSRLEEGRMNLRMSTELLDEVVAEALRHVNRKSTEYHLTVHSDQEYTLVQIDAKLIIQVLINIVDNAIKYTPPGSDIQISWRTKGSFVYVSIADNGPGIADEAKPHIFDMFYSASNKIVDSRRSMGLGLALCKSIINAHGGEITVSDHAPHGTIFTFSIPAGEVDLHE